MRATVRLSTLSLLHSEILSVLRSETLSPLYSEILSVVRSETLSLLASDSNDSSMRVAQGRGAWENPSDTPSHVCSVYLPSVEAER